MQNTVYVAKDWSYLISLSHFPSPHNRYRQNCLTTVVSLVPRSTCSLMGAIFCGQTHLLFQGFSSHSISLEWYTFLLRTRRVPGSMIPIIGYCGWSVDIFHSPSKKYAMIPPITFTIIFRHDAMLVEMRCRVIKQGTLQIFGN